MGSQHSHEHDLGKESGSGTSTPRGGSRRGMTPRGSGASLEPEKAEPSHQTSMVPVEKLAKLLCQRSQKEEGVNGVTEKSFTNYVFPQYPDLARRFFRHLHRAARAKGPHLPPAAFRAQCEQVLALLDDALITETYVKLFTCDDAESTVSAEGLRALLLASYRLSMDHYPEGPGQACYMINQTLTAVVSGCFTGKDAHSVGFVGRWLDEHCHRVILPLHRYCVHVLSTRHRELESALSGTNSPTLGAGLELSTPVLERSAWPAAAEGDPALLPVSAAWIVAAAAPPLYSRPCSAPPSVHGASALASKAWLARLVCAVPSHWTPLYASREHGLAANRFLHHTLAYRGPTLVVVKARGSDDTFVICSAGEWRESHRYYGSPECAFIRLQPSFALLEKGANMLYLNTSVRGYPHGLRVGMDPRKPLLSINGDFDHFDFNGATYAIDNIEVWGCGDAASREVQLDIKKWQVREAERQSQVKLSAADWIEHPDRYLLELAGRPQYNNSAS